MNPLLCGGNVVFPCRINETEADDRRKAQKSTEK
jgi:hypothetical protein